MKTCALLLTSLASAAAFAPSTQQKATTAIFSTADLEGMAGVSVETGNKIFDPVGIAAYAPSQFLREAELANGRAAMLANVGWFWPKIFGLFNSDDVTTTDPIEAIGQADNQWWAQFVIFCATCEAIKYRGQMEGKSYTGDGPAVFDWTNSWKGLTDAQKEKYKLYELKHARLAMLGFASYVADYFIPGSVPLL